MARLPIKLKTFRRDQRCASNGRRHSRRGKLVVQIVHSSIGSNSEATGLTMTFPQQIEPLYTL